MPRKYQHMQLILPQIKEMLQQGMTQKEIEKVLGLTGDRPIHNLLKRERKKEIQGIPKQRERKPAKTLQECQDEEIRMIMLWLKISFQF